jgi:multidrug efflux pump subunit AcrA (membrane-fusion protein)
MTLFILIPGCSKAPTETAAAADSAFEALTAAQADLYAAAEFEEAQAALAAARAELAVQNGKSAISRRYKEAEALFEQARTLSESALTTSQSGRAAAEASANEAIALTRSRISQSTNLIEMVRACPRRAKEITADTALLEGKIDGFVSAMPTLESMISEANFLGAHSEATSLIEQLDAINGDLTSALDKLGCSVESSTAGETSA